MKQQLTTLLISMFFIVLHGHAQFTTLHEFNSSTSGSASYATLVSDGTYLYGTTSNGLSANFGTIFRVMPDGSAFETIYEFGGTPDGRQPICGLYFDGEYLFGTTREDGLYSAGTVFKILPDGSGYQILHHFNTTTDGQWPGGTVISDGVYLYGTTNRGLSGINGLVYRVKKDGTDYQTLHVFDGVNSGSSPRGDLVSDGTWLYGLTETGGINDDGVMFRIMPDGSDFEKLFDFEMATSGEFQMASLLYHDGWMYGMNQSGGANGQGTLFKIQPDGSNHTVLLDFELLTTGRAGTSTPITDGTYLYAMTQYGGEYDDGAIFRIKLDGTDFMKMFDFQDFVSGKNPTAGLLLLDDLLYGVTNIGGANNQGVIFQFQPQASNDIERFEISNLRCYPNPTSDRMNFAGASSIDRIVISDLAGKVIIDQQKLHGFSFDVSKLEMGLYTVIIEQSGNRQSLKVVVE